MIFIVNGHPGSGKTSFEEDVQYIMGTNHCQILSTITFPKEVAKFCGWKGDKTPENRRFLSDLKDLLTRWNDVPFKKTIAQVQMYKSEYEYYGIDETRYCIFIDVREPDEIRRYCEELGALSVLLTRREGGEMIISNHADANVLNYNYDIIINNDGSRVELAEKATQFVNQYIKKKTV